MTTWTLARRLLQSQRIHKSKPWEKSTGPNTPLGKLKSRSNSYKHGRHHLEIRNINKKIAIAKKQLRRLSKMIPL